MRKGRGGNSRENIVKREQPLWERKGVTLWGKEKVWANRSVFRLLSIGSPIVENLKPTSQIDCEPKWWPTHQSHFWRAQFYKKLVANPCDARESYQFCPNDVTLAIGIQHRFSGSTFLFFNFIYLMSSTKYSIHSLYLKNSWDSIWIVTYHV